MMRGMLSMLLASFLLLQPALNSRAAGAQAANESSRTAAIRQKVKAAGAGSQIEVTLLDKNKLQGRLISVGTDDFIVQSGEGPDSVTHLVRFEDVRSVKVFQQQAASTASQNKSKISRRGKMMLIVGVAALVFGIITFATTKGP